MTAFYPCAPGRRDLAPSPVNASMRSMEGFPAVLIRGRGSQKRKRCPGERTVPVPDWADAKKASAPLEGRGQGSWHDNARLPDPDPQDR